MLVSLSGLSRTTSSDKLLLRGRPDFFFCLGMSSVAAFSAALSALSFALSALVFAAFAAFFCFGVKSSSSSEPSFFQARPLP
jgi:hypothetical protein